MSNCNCGFDIGDPRVSRHAEDCAGKRIAELEQQLSELREAIRKEIDGYRYDGWFNAEKMEALLKQGGE